MVLVYIVERTEAGPDVIVLSSRHGLHAGDMLAMAFLAIPRLTIVRTLVRDLRS